MRDIMSSYILHDFEKLNEGGPEYTFSSLDDVPCEDGKSLFWSSRLSSCSKVTRDDIMREICSLRREMNDDHTGQNEQLSKMQCRIKELMAANVELRDGLKEALALLEKNSLRAFWCKLFVGYALISILLTGLFLFCPMTISLLALIAIMLGSIAGFYIGGKMDS